GSRFPKFHLHKSSLHLVHTASEAVVRGVIGKPVQLSCFYHVAQDKDISDMCWGRGPCPKSKCNNKILHTTGDRVTFRKSRRYSLRGNISSGDVSLTIGRVKAEDAGTYCCRVEIPGWFNDIKQNMQLEVRAPPVRITTTRKAPVSPRHFRKTTFAPQATSDHQTTAETAVLLTTNVPETTAHPTFAVTANDTFPSTMVTTSALPDFSTGFQAADMRTEDDDVFCPAESVTLPGVTAESPSTLLTAERTKGAHTSLMVEDVSTAVDIATLKSVNSVASGFCFNGNLLSLHIRKDALKQQCAFAPSIVIYASHYSLGPTEDLEKVFSDSEGENNIFSL
uniref:Ig-like domain-containing protein n=1 Tax=Bubo bubo TaxID=30461 RepID=A0A8C0EMU5_BUBBB